MSESLSIIYIFLISIIGFYLAHTTVKKTKNNFIYFVFFEHFAFTFLYYFYTLNNRADATMFYSVAKESSNLMQTFGTGTEAIIFISTFFVMVFNFSKLALFTLFGLFGFIGFLYLIKMLESSRIKFIGIPAIFIILLTPGFHFWTSALGKDSLIFMAIMMFFYSLKNINKKIPLLIISFGILTFVRPYLSIIILISIILAFIFRNPKKIKFYQIFILIFTMGLLIAFTPFIKNFMNLDSLSIDSLINRSEFYNNQGTKRADNVSSYIDVSNYSLPFKMFSYFFRPLFFDAHSILQLIISFENLFLLALLYKWLISIKFKIMKWYRLLNLVDKIMFYYVIIGWIIMASSMYNLGLASRQKYMLLPVLFILIFKNFNRSIRVNKN